MQAGAPKYTTLLGSIRQLLQESRARVARAVNTSIITTYWQIGQYIVEFEQHGADRAKYGASLLQTLASDLTQQFGKGFSYRNLNLFRQLYQTFPILQSPIAEFAQTPIPFENALQKVCWTHLVRLLSVKNETEGIFT